MQQHIIYIPGLGDGYDVFRRLGLLFWRRPGRVVTHVSMRWRDPHETYEEKLVRIEQVVSRYPDHEVVLVGESAGGSVVVAGLRRFDKKVSRIVTVCGMNHGARSVSSKLYKKNSAFKDAMNNADRITSSLTDAEKARTLTIYSSGDFTVRPEHTLLSGVRSYDLKTPGHLTSILSVLLFRYGLITR